MDMQLRGRLPYFLFAAGLLVFVAVGLCLASSLRHDAPHEAVEWLPYSDELLAAKITRNQEVFLFVYAELDPLSSKYLQQLDWSTCSRLSTSEDFSTLVFKYSDWSNPTIKAVWDVFGHTKYSFLVHYLPNNKTVVYRDMSQIVPVGASER